MIRGWLMLVLINLFIFLLLIPAYDFRDDLHKISNSRLTLLHINGSLWYGDASLGISDGNRTYALPGKLNWHPVVRWEPSKTTPHTVEGKAGCATRLRMTCATARCPATDSEAAS